MSESPIFKVYFVVFGILIFSFGIWQDSIPRTIGGLGLIFLGSLVE
jgi:hypothetical protein